MNISNHAKLLCWYNKCLTRNDIKIKCSFFVGSEYNNNNNINCMFRSSSESAVEEETVGLSIPDEEEEGSVGHELDVRGPFAWNFAYHDSSGCARFGSLLVHVDVGLMENIHHPQFTAAAGYVREFGLVFVK